MGKKVIIYDSLVDIQRKSIERQQFVKLADYVKLNRELKTLKEKLKTLLNNPKP
jgi:hypothetical protein